jgi:hypothetical protein
MSDDLLKNLVKGKRVAFVGPSAHLQGSLIGSYIDSYDIVARVNELHVPSSEEINYGSRTDLVFHNLNSDDGIRCLKNDMEKYPGACDNIKLLICSQKKYDNAGVDIVKLFHNENKFSIPFYHLGDDFVDSAARQMGLKPNTGMMSIIKLMTCDLSELFVTGISFYAQGNNSTQVYRKDASLKNGSSYLTGECSHPQAPQKRFFKSLLLNHSKIIKIDSYMERILQIKYDNVKHFE